MLDKVTMRRLAQELDTGPASLYVYVRNTAELHAAMLEQLLGQVDLSPVTATGDWRDRLIEILTSYTVILFGQPGLGQSVLVTRPSGPAYLSLAEAILALLAVGGHLTTGPGRGHRSGPDHRPSPSLSAQLAGSCWSHARQYQASRSPVTWSRTAVTFGA